MVLGSCRPTGRRRYHFSFVKGSSSGYAQGRGRMPPFPWALQAGQDASAAVGPAYGRWPVWSSRVLRTGDPQDRVGWTAFVGVNGCRHRSAEPSGPPILACRSRAPVLAAAAWPGNGLAGMRGMTSATGLDSLGTGPSRACLWLLASKGLREGMPRSWRSRPSWDLPGC